MYEKTFCKARLHGQVVTCPWANIPPTPYNRNGTVAVLFPGSVELLLRTKEKRRSRSYASTRRKKRCGDVGDIDYLGHHPRLKNTDPIIKSQCLTAILV